MAYKGTKFWLMLKGPQKQKQLTWQVWVLPGLGLMNVVDHEDPVGFTEHCHTCLPVAGEHMCTLDVGVLGLLHHT